MSNSLLKCMNLRLIVLSDLNKTRFDIKSVIVGSRSENCSMPVSLPDNIFELKNEDFFNIVQQQCGKTMVEIFRYLEINSADYLLTINTEDLFAFFHQDSPELAAMKSKIGVMLSDGSFVVKKGLLFQADTLIRALHIYQQQNSSLSRDLIISSTSINKHPILRQVIHFVETSLSNSFMYKVMETMVSNYFRTKNHFSYCVSLREFASCVYIFGGRSVYEFIRINIPGFLPSLSVIRHEIDTATGRITEGEFRYNLMTDYLTSQGTSFIFAAEDCTAVVPRIVFDTRTNMFVGFVLSLKDGIPIIDSYTTESFCELEQWFDTSSKSYLINLQMIQPINLNNVEGAPFILSCYGTDNKFTTEDILMKWVHMVNRCYDKKVKLVGFSTDCDSRYLRSMRLFSGFFAEMLNQQIHMRNDAFHVEIPKVVFNDLHKFEVLMLFSLLISELDLVLHEKSLVDVVLPRQYSFMYKIEKSIVIVDCHDVIRR